MRAFFATGALLGLLLVVGACGGGGAADAMPAAVDAAGPDAACLKCGARVMMSMPTESLCSGTSKMLYDTLQQCLCMGPCMAACADNSCMGKPTSLACVNCAADGSAAGCGAQFNACSNDH